MTAKRVGAKSRGDVTPEVLKKLNEGVLESATLSEALAVDFGILLLSVAPDIGDEEKRRMHEARTLGITKRMDTAAGVLASYLGEDAAGILMKHGSDTVRGWAAFIIGRNGALALQEKLSFVRPLADDPHFGVREWAWLAMRESIAAELREAISRLVPWAESGSANIRRFAIEATRPRGVWSKHIPELKKDPGMGRVLLERVMEDESRYVRDSCANWLNDAAKSDPDWVTAFCREWQSKSSAPSVGYIAKRGLRSLNSKRS